MINHRVSKAVAQLRQIGTDFDAVAQPRGLELLLHGCYRHHPLVGVPQVLPRLLRLHGPRFEHENARDDLQAIGDAVLHLLKQHLLLPQQLILFALRVAPLVMSSIASSSRVESGFSSSNTWRALSSMVRRPMVGNSCSTS